MRHLFLGIVLALILVFYQHARAATLIVPDNYATVQAAINAANPGDTVLVRPGTYFESLTLNKAILLTAETYNIADPTQNTTILDGGSAAYVILIPSGVTPMPTVRGFVIRHGDDGIQSLSEHVVEYNYLLLSSGDLNDYGAGSGGYNHHNVYFRAGDDAIDLDNMNRPLLIEHNQLLYSLDDGIETRLQDNTAPAQPITITIRDNEIIGSDEDGLQFIDYSQANDTQRRFVITRNLIANSRFAGVGLMPNANSVEDYSGANVVEAIRIYNNTLYSNTYGLSGGDNLVAFNNLIISSTVRGVWRVQGQNSDNSVVAYTLFYNNGTDAQQSALGLGNIFGLSPLFVAPPNPGPDAAWGTVDDDFSGLRLQAGSPAIDVGTTQYIANDGGAIPPVPISDFFGLAPDLGWKEFVPPPPNTATPTVTPTPTAPSTETLTPIANATSTKTLTPTSTGALLTQTTTPTPTPTWTPIPGLIYHLYLPLIFR